MKARFLLLVVSLVLMAAGASASCGAYCYGDQGYSAGGYGYYSGPSNYGGTYGSYNSWNGYESWDYYGNDGRYYSYYGPSYYGYNYNYNYNIYNPNYFPGFNQHVYYYPPVVYYYEPYYDSYDYRVQYYEPGFSISVGW